MKLAWPPKNSEQYQFIAAHFTPFFDEKRYHADDSIHCCEVRVEEVLAAVSMVRIIPEEQRVTLLYTLVDSSFRRRGINSLIKDAVENFARDKGADHLWGHVRENNEASLNSLLKSGFEIVDEAEQFYKNGDRKLTIRKNLL